MGIQTIVTPTGEDMVVMPRSDYDALVAAAEEAFEDGADAATYAAAVENARPEDVLPPEVSATILRGVGRIQAFREWRTLSEQQLASATGMTMAELKELERGERLLSRDAAARIAEALTLPAGWLAV